MKKIGKKGITILTGVLLLSVLAFGVVSAFSLYAGASNNSVIVSDGPAFAASSVKVQTAVISSVASDNTASFIPGNTAEALVTVSVDVADNGATAGTPVAIQLNTTFAGVKVSPIDPVTFACGAHSTACATQYFSVTGNDGRFPLNEQHTISADFVVTGFTSSTAAGKFGTLVWLYEAPTYSIALQSVIVTWLIK